MNRSGFKVSALFRAIALISIGGLCMSETHAMEGNPGTVGCFITPNTGVCGSGLTANPNQINCGGIQYPEYRWTKPDIRSCVPVVNGYRNCWTVVVHPVLFRARCDPNNLTQIVEDDILWGEGCDSAARSDIVCGRIQGPPIPTQGN
jgi:hypothetical protein